MSGASLNGEPRHVHRAERASAILLDYSRTVCSGAATQPQTCASKHKYDTSLNALLYSVYPAAPHERHIVDTDPLIFTAANASTAISSHGTKAIQLQFNSKKYVWSFRLAQVSQPLLGSDFFLAQHNLLVDVARRRLISADTFNYVQLQTNTDPVYQLNVCSTPNDKYSGIIIDKHCCSYMLMIN